MWLALGNKRISKEMEKKYRKSSSSMILVLMFVFAFSSNLASEDTATESGDVLVEIQSIYIDGQGITKPGEYPYTQGMTLADAISLAGGISWCGSKRAIRITRLTEGEKKRWRIRLSDALHPEDIVHCPCPFF